MTVNTKISKKNARKAKVDADGFTAAEVKQILASARKTWIKSRIQEAQAALAQGLPLFRPFGSIENRDAIAMMRDLDANSADSVITDPPYGIGMAPWDPKVPGNEVWMEAFRILAPGGYCVVAAAPRTAHLTAAALEAAGFLIRDVLAWRYTQSFPSAQGLGGQRRSNLKTNQEPWIVAQKPVERGLTLRENWAIHRTGGVRTGANGEGG